MGGLISPHKCNPLRHRGGESHLKGPQFTVYRLLFKHGFLPWILCLCSNYTKAQSGQVASDCPLWKGGLSLQEVLAHGSPVATSTSLGLRLNSPHWWLVTLSCQSLQVQNPDRPLWKGSLTGPLAVRSHQLACHSPAVARVQLPVWAVLSMLSNVPPSCCVATSIWSSLARQISMLSDLFGESCYANPITQVCPVTAA